MKTHLLSLTQTEEKRVTLFKDREHFSSPSVYRGSTPKGGGSLKNKPKGAAEATPFSSPLGTFPLPSVLTPSHHDRANHSSHDTQHPRHEIIRHLREKSIKPQREKYSGKKVHAHHTVK